MQCITWWAFTHIDKGNFSLKFCAGHDDCTSDCAVVLLHVPVDFVHESMTHKSMVSEAEFNFWGLNESGPAQEGMIGLRGKGLLYSQRHVKWLSNIEAISTQVHHRKRDATLLFLYLSTITENHDKNSQTPMKIKSAYGVRHAMKAKVCPNQGHMLCSSCQHRRPSPRRMISKVWKHVDGTIFGKSNVYRWTDWWATTRLLVNCLPFISPSQQYWFLMLGLTLILVVMIFKSFKSYSWSAWKPAVD